MTQVKLLFLTANNKTVEASDLAYDLLMIEVLEGGHSTIAEAIIELTKNIDQQINELGYPSTIVASLQGIIMTAIDRLYQFAVSHGLVAAATPEPMGELIRFTARNA